MQPDGLGGAIENGDGEFDPTIETSDVEIGDQLLRYRLVCEHEVTP